MGLPFDINTTYVASSTPKIKSDDLNDIQRRLVDLDRLTARSDYNFVDDFDRAAVASTMWDSISGSPSIITDFAANGFWAAQSNPAAGAAIAVRKANGLPWRTNDLRFHARVRVVSLVTSGSNVSVYPAGTKLYFKAAVGNANWQAGVTGVDNDTGVAFSSSYQHLDIFRISGVAYFYIDGALVHSEAMATDMTTDLTGFESNAAAATGVANLVVDAIKFSSVRV
jgi:hypothetical protein